ncbi:NAD(P)/FAD-dependent oxidoreductase [Microbacterium sediminicola]|uniref:NAD(P)/FAD-dependent oxidoreductase n=1 Tax=Microbacterium sediminicola TaxID=415210 RepID=A0ABP4U9A2_9MICO
MSTHVEALIVGAGFAGLATALELRAAGVDDIALIERADDVGGTWRENRYPGVACDIPAHLYALGRHPWPHWSHEFAPGDEIQNYLRTVADRSGVRALIRFDTPMTASRWHEDRWHVETPTGDIHARALLLACGRLTDPSLPDIPGSEGFPGVLTHTARWDPATEVDGRRIAVIGTGASGVQLVPELVRRGAHVTLFQRTAAWVLPRGGHGYTDAERARFAAAPEEMAQLRERLFVDGEARYASRSGDAAAAAAASDQALAHLADQIPDRRLRAALTPDYAFGCKRVLLSDDFYPAVASAAVTLEPSALERIEGHTLISATGTRHEVDLVVFATGFRATEQPYARFVTGESGETLADHWSSGMTSVLSTVVPGFPNLFVLNGPNASLGHNSSILMLEEQAAYAARTLAKLTDGEILRPDPAAEADYCRRIDERAAPTAWITGGCHNWYVDERSGRLTLLWPGTVAEFRAQMRAADGSEFLREPVTGVRRSTT